MTSHKGWLLGAVMTLMAMVPGASWAQTVCQIRVVQGGQEVAPTLTGGGRRFSLRPEEFQLEVLPAVCAPSIATLPNADLARQVFAKPLVYSHRLMFLMAANDADSDRLLWWASPAFDAQLLKAPDPGSFDGKQYLRLCDELNFCPNVFPAFSARHPFKASETGAKAQALFKRLDATNGGLAQAKGKTVWSVIYTVWRALPSEYPMADAREMLLQPHLVAFDFSAP